MSLIQEIDFGTPRSKSEKTVTLTIDGQSVTVPEGTSIMRAAMEAGTQLPQLSATDARPGRPHPDRAAEETAQGRDGTLHLRPSAGLSDLCGQRRLRIAGHGGRGRPARCALRL